MWPEMTAKPLFWSVKEKWPCVLLCIEINNAYVVKTGFIQNTGNSYKINCLNKLKPHNKHDLRQNPDSLESNIGKAASMKQLLRLWTDRGLMKGCLSAMK